MWSARVAEWEPSHRADACDLLTEVCGLLRRCACAVPSMQNGSPTAMRGACELLTEACGLLRQGTCGLPLAHDDTSIQEEGSTVCGGPMSPDRSSFLGQFTRILRRELGTEKNASEGAVISEKQKSRKSNARFSHRKPAPWLMKYHVAPM